MNAKLFKGLLTTIMLLSLSGCMGSEPLSPEMQKLQTRLDATPDKPIITTEKIVIEKKKVDLAGIYKNDASKYWAAYGLIEQAFQETLKDLNIDQKVRHISLSKYNYTKDHKELLLKVYLTQSAYPRHLYGVYKGLDFGFEYGEDSITITLRSIHSSLDFKNSSLARENKKISVQDDMTKLLNSYEKFDKIFIEKLQNATLSNKINTAAVTQISIVYNGSKELFTAVNKRIMKRSNSSYYPNRDPQSIWQRYNWYTSFKIDNTNIVVFFDPVDMGLSKNGTVVTFDVLLYGPLDSAVTKKALISKLEEVYNNENNDLEQRDVIDDMIQNVVSFDIDTEKENFGFMDMI